MPVIPEAYLGHAAAIATSVCWTITSIFFAAASRRLGPTLLNLTRLSLAVLVHLVVHHYRAGGWLPDAQRGQVLYLALSGLVGLTIGDQALFTAFNDVGPRLAMLLMTTAPLFAAMFGWLVLGEQLHWPAWIGMALTTAGVAWVVLERPATPTVANAPHRVRGIVLGVLAGACQAGGLLLSKQGMGHGWLPRGQWLDPQAATLTRMFFAALAAVPVMAWSRRGGGYSQSSTIDRGRTLRVGLLMACGGVVFGPFAGVWLSLIASDRAPLGVA